MEEFDNDFMENSDYCGYCGTKLDELGHCPADVGGELEEQ